MKQSTWATIVIAILIVTIGGAAYWHLTHNTANTSSTTAQITTFEECASAGYPIEESEPRRCTVNGQTFVETAAPAGVMATSSTNIRVTSPTVDMQIGLPLIIRGEARAFENTFAWRLRDANGTVLASGHAMANAADAGQFGAFAISSSYAQPKGTHGIVEVFVNSAKDGSEVDKVSVPVIFQQVESQNVKVYFSSRTKDPQSTQCEVVYPVTRRIAKTTTPATAAIGELLSGTMNTEEQQGFFSSLNPDIQLNSINIKDGTAYVDFSSLLTQGVAGSCRVQAIRAQIEKTLMQFSTVQHVIISVGGKTDGVLEP